MCVTQELPPCPAWPAGLQSLFPQRLFSDMKVASLKAALAALGQPFNGTVLLCRRRLDILMADPERHEAVCDALFHAYAAQRNAATMAHRQGELEQLAGHVRSLTDSSAELQARLERYVYLAECASSRRQAAPEDNVPAPRVLWEVLASEHEEPLVSIIKVLGGLSHLYHDADAAAHFDVELLACNAALVTLATARQAMRDAMPAVQPGDDKLPSYMAEELNCAWRKQRTAFSTSNQAGTHYGPAGVDMSTVSSAVVATWTSLALCAAERRSGASARATAARIAADVRRFGAVRAAPPAARRNSWAGPGRTPLGLLPFPFESARAALDELLAATPASDEA
jgi:hypothetical protein